MTFFFLQSPSYVMQMLDETSHITLSGMANYYSSCPCCFQCKYNSAETFWMTLVSCFGDMGGNPIEQGENMQTFTQTVTWAHNGPLSYGSLVLLWHLCSQHWYFSINYNNNKHCFYALADGKRLSGDVTHYVVPDAGVVRDFLEVLEFREIHGVVFTQTACQALQNTRGRRYTTKHCMHYSSA